MIYLVLFLGLAGCDELFGNDKGDGGGDDSETESTSSPGDDSGTTNPTDAEFCDQRLSSAPPGGPDCQTGTLVCGDSVTGTTEGGLSQLGGSSYLDWFCDPTPDAYAGPERVYLFVMEGRGQATVTLESPCVDLDLMVMHYGDEANCPSPGAGISECEASEKSGVDTVVVSAFERYAFYVVVDGKNGNTGNYRLSVSCD